MADYAKAYQAIHANEGGYQKASSDTGNYNTKGELVGTNWGVSAKVYETYLGRTPSEADMRNMPQETAIKIFKQNYWDAANLSKIDSQIIANAIFDHYINRGNIIRMLPLAINMNVKSNKLSDVVIERINGLNEAELSQRISDARIKDYRMIDNKTEDEQTSWANRSKKFIIKVADKVERETQSNWRFYLFVTLVTATVLLYKYGQKKS